MTIRAAAVDIGTNSVRLLIGEVARGREGAPTLRTLRRVMTITRLGEGVDERGLLKPEAVARTAETLRRYRELMDREGAQAWRVAATSAARDAANAAEFMAMVRGIMGTEPRVISGKEEARLTFLGATYDLGELRPARGAIMVVDIGGGSTEIVMGEGREIVYERSLDVGCVRMSERYLVTDPPGAQELGEMEVHIRSVLVPHLEEIARLAPALVVGTAGTVTTLSGLKLGLREYDGEAIHHSWLALAEVEELYARLRSLPLEERRSLLRLEPGRADVIVGGTGVLAVLMRELGQDLVLVSEKDILDGLALTAAAGGLMP